MKVQYQLIINNRNITFLSIPINKNKNMFLKDLKLALQKEILTNPNTKDVLSYLINNVDNQFLQWILANISFYQYTAHTDNVLAILQLTETKRENNLYELSK